MRHPPHRQLPRLLGEARRWFEEAMFAALEAAGEQPVSAPQAQLFSVLEDGGTTVSEAARRMGVTRQTAHQAVHGLVAAGMLEQVPDPASARRRLIRRTAAGERVHRQAELILEGLEERLAERIGRDAVNALRAALETPWGDPPTPALGTLRESGPEATG
ncbi:MarR family winged helix-turn-helix transcriptional regulator (plasmid) [Streptomyces sp. CA-294286]|uniref:MarR family winged helix-turn-helix transcriptional regulator n=1 Tax=Streptomyces sp. CA-294286 TaxID=3240070 RepID=UPI003D8BB4F5